MLRLEVSVSADRDLLTIRHYTRKNWGQKQADDYVRKLAAGFNILCENPALGSVASYLKPGYRKWIEGKHHIIYRNSEEVLLIVRILHVSVRLADHFE